MAAEMIKINRAPVMTLWAAVVAERQGFDREEALTLAKVVTGLNAQSKGQRLGIYGPGESLREERGDQARRRPAGETYQVTLLGRPVPATNTDHGVRAVDKDAPVDPRSVQHYLEKKFGPHLDAARQALEELAAAFPAEQLATRAYDLYEKFRPQIPEGVKGWGAAGDLDLEKIRALAADKLG